MGSAISGCDTPADRSDPRSAPVARVSRSALIRNARIAGHAGGRSFSARLLRADAWGHGEDLVRGVLDGEGFTFAPGGGAVGDVDPRTLFGLPGGAADACPVLRLHGTVLSVKELRAGEGVSYGYSYRAPRDTRVALVTGGYAQGVVRALGNVADVSIRGSRQRIVGRVAMDVCVVDVADVPVVRGDQAVFLGEAGRGEPSLAEWVAATGMLPAELVAAVGLRAIREVAP